MDDAVVSKKRRDFEEQRSLISEDLGDGLKFDLPGTVSARAEPVRVTSHPYQNNPTSSRDNSTNMDPIQAAIGAINSREPGETFSNREVAKRLGIDRTTLARRHQEPSVSINK
jgi:hypothetical protein